MSGLGRLVALVFPSSSLSRLLEVGSRYLRLSRPIARVLDEADFDVLHTMSPSDYVIGALANGFSRRQRLVMSRLSLNFYRNDARLFAVVERLLHRRVDLAVGNAQAILRELETEGIPTSKLMLVRNGIDPTKFIHSMIDRHEARSRLEIPRDGLVFTSVANLFPYKGHVDLLQALHLVRDRLAADWTLLVAGREINGSLETLRRLAEQLGLSANVRFLGQRRDIPHILSAADIHVSASHHEGFPNNLLEAMCAGLPVVATAVGGVPELVMNGNTGLLVPPKDPLSLAGAILSLAGDLSQRESFGAAGRQRVVQHFSIRNSVTALQDVYLRAAKSGRELQALRHRSGPLIDGGEQCAPQSRKFGH